MVPAFKPCKIIPPSHGLPRHESWIFFSTFEIFLCVYQPWYHAAEKTIQKTATSQTKINNHQFIWCQSGLNIYDHMCTYQIKSICIYIYNINMHYIYRYILDFSYKYKPLSILSLSNTRLWGWTFRQQKTPVSFVKASWPPNSMTLL